MPLTKSKGNMYPWVTHTHTHLGGECPHECKYCYVQATRKRFGHDRYAAELRFIDDELKVNYGSGRTIFIEHCNDMFADDVPRSWIRDILLHCRDFPYNTYVLQTKNPSRCLEWLEHMPPNRLIGCTIETSDREVAAAISRAPSPVSRARAMVQVSLTERTFITIEPILQGDMAELAAWVHLIKPDFVNIGADSKGTGLDEPAAVDVKALIRDIRSHGIEIREKRNLERLIKP